MAMATVPRSRSIYALLLLHNSHSVVCFFVGMIAPLDINSFIAPSMPILGTLRIVSAGFWSVTVHQYCNVRAVAVVDTLCEVCRAATLFFCRWRSCCSSFVHWSQIHAAGVAVAMPSKSAITTCDFRFRKVLHL
jgi:hypothetical protein